MAGELSTHARLLALGAGDEPPVQATQDAFCAPVRVVTQLRTHGGAWSCAEVPGAGSGVGGEGGRESSLEEQVEIAGLLLPERPGRLLGISRCKLKFETGHHPSWVLIEGEGTPPPKT